MPSSDMHDDFTVMVTATGAGVGGGPLSNGNGSGGSTRTPRTAIYAPSSGEKHVLFYPTSPAPSAASDDPRSWSQGTPSWTANVITNHKMANNASETSSSRLKRSADDWSEDCDRRAGSATPSHSHRTEPRYNFKIGIYGWRKRCLYLLILGLLIMVIINLALTLWVLKVMEFSSEGMGQLRIVPGGLQLNGQAMVLDALIASTIRSRKGQPITIESSRNLTFSTRDRDGFLSNTIFLGNDKFECAARTFRITDERGGVVFTADRHEVAIGADMLRVTGVGGAVFDGSVQTPLVRAEAAHDLRLESPTRSLELRAPISIAIESRAGGITASCLTDMKLTSVAGAVRLEAGSVLMPGLPTAQRSGHRASTVSADAASKTQQQPQDIFQLCVCNDGKLFLAPANGICTTDDSSRMCR